MNKPNIAVIAVLFAIAISFGYLIYLNYHSAPPAANDQSPSPLPSAQSPTPATSTTSTSTQSQTPQPITGITIYCSNNGCAPQQINAGAGTLTRNCYRVLSDCQAALQTNCQADSDCAAKECCHPTGCININYKNVCNLLCTQDCVGPLDCNAGSCKCVNNSCSVISSTPSY